MARERVVTRTIISTEAEILTINPTTTEVTVKVYTITPSTDDTSVALKIAKKLYEDDNTVLVKVNNLVQKETIYGMREVDFIRLATPMDSDRHFVEDETEEVAPVETEEVAPVETEEVAPVDKPKRNKK